MTGPTHILFGVASAVVICRLSGLPLDPLSFLALFLGSLAPDIDADSGSITRPGKLFRGFLPRGVANLLDQLAGVVSAIARSISGHRGLFHTPILAVSLFLLALYLASYRLEWFAIGYLSHILADACTVRGVPLLWPLSKQEISFSPIRTGSRIEALVAACLAIFVVTFGFELLPQSTQQGFESIWQVILKRQGRG